MRHNVLIIEDDRELASHLKDIFVQSGSYPVLIENGIKAINLLKGDYTPDIVLLDLGLPDISGESVFNEIKLLRPDVPVIILTSKNSISDVVEGFNLGAVDYITKPFAPEELLARVNARLKIGELNDGIIKINDLTIDLERVRAHRGKKELPLTKHEFKLLEYLARNKNKVLSREMILNKVWEFPLEIESRVVDVYIGYLRKKVDGGFPKKMIVSVRGFGYKLSDE